MQIIKEEDILLMGNQVSNGVKVSSLTVLNGTITSESSYLLFSVNVAILKNTVKVKLLTNWPQFINIVY